MAEKQLKTRIQLKIDTEENWSKATNFIPKEGEVIFYKPDDGNPRYRIKIGDGTTTVNSLSFAFDIDTELSATSINPVQNSTINTALSSKAEKGNFIPFVTATYSSEDSDNTYYTATVDEWSDANTIDDLEGRIAYIKLDTDASDKAIMINFNNFDNIMVIRRTSGGAGFTSSFNFALKSGVPFLALIGKVDAISSYGLRCINLDHGTKPYGKSDFANPVNIDKGGTGASTAPQALINLGLTATATELNYCDGVTSNIQTQLDDKAALSHGTHVSYGTSTKALGTSSAGTASTVSRSDHVHALPALTSCTGTLTIAKGGTGATSAPNALASLGAVAKAGDTMGGKLVANATSVATLGTAQVRNIWAGTANISEVEGSLKEGDIYLQYEEG